jgi:hypothetical protein
LVGLDAQVVVYVPEVPMKLCMPILVILLLPLATADAKTGAAYIDKQRLQATCTGVSAESDGKLLDDADDVPKDAGFTFGGGLLPSRTGREGRTGGPSSSIRPKIANKST